MLHGFSKNLLGISSTISQPLAFVLGVNACYSMSRVGLIAADYGG